MCDSSGTLQDGTQSAVSSPFSEARFADLCEFSFDNGPRGQAGVSMEHATEGYGPLVVKGQKRIRGFAAKLEAPSNFSVSVAYSSLCRIRILAAMYCPRLIRVPPLMCAGRDSSGRPFVRVKESAICRQNIEPHVLQTFIHEFPGPARRLGRAPLYALWQAAGHSPPLPRLQRLCFTATRLKRQKPRKGA